MPAIALLCLIVSTVASTAFAADPAKNPAGWNDDVKLTEAVDVNPAPDVVEVSLTARLAQVPIADGRVAPAWTYDGGLPGPLIRAKVGDRLIVRFRNELPQPTTVHWHGVRVPIEMDGVPEISQDAVPTGGSFDYDFVLRDAGLFWYHPHVMSAAQVGFGLYGALLVEDPAERSLIGDLDELLLVLSDIGISPSGELEPPDSGGSAGMVFGREGNDVLVNGRVRPRIRARPGVLQRWRVVNTARSRFFLLQIEGHRFVQIGGDGGLREAATPRDTVLVTPGERVDLLLLPEGRDGTSLLLTSMLYNRGYGSVEYRVPEDLLTIDLVGEAPSPAPRIPDVTRAMTPPTTAGVPTVDLVFTLPPVDSNGHSEFRINGAPHWKAKPYHAALGARQIWRLQNDTPWDHPFHLHGYFFYVLDAAGQPVRPLELKDTVNVPMKATVDILVHFDERPGEWMFHCHILDHADGGFMGTVHVGEPKPRRAPHAAHSGH